MQHSTVSDPLQLPLSGVRLIEASAGTGKTWTIAVLYLRLVLGLGHDGPIPALLPPQILVLSFTRASTAELRERIRSRLEEAARVCRGQQCGDPLLQQLLTRAEDPADLMVWARRLELAAQWMDEAAVSTIHSWCQRMLGEHAFGSGRPFEQATEADESAMLAEAIDDYYREHLSQLSADDSTLLEQLLPFKDLRKWLQQNHEFEPEQLIGLPSDLCSPQQLLQEQLGAPRDQLLFAYRALQEILREQGETLNQLIERALNKDLDRRSYKSLDFKRLLDWSRDEGSLEDLLALGNNYSKFAQSALKDGTKKAGITPRHRAFDYLDQIATAWNSLQTSILPIAVSGHALLWVRERVADAKRRSAQIGYSDMLTQLQEALRAPGGSLLAAQLRQRHPVALIDEFQDTDVRQWSIFEQIYLSPEAQQDPHCALILIGDPKQAIYGFRGADLNTYLAARTRAQPPIHRLQFNHRSTQPMIAAVNRLFERAERAKPDGAFGLGSGEQAVEFHPVQPGRDDPGLLVDGQPCSALRVVLLSWEPLPKASYRACAAENAAAEIRRLLQAGLDGKARFAGGAQTLCAAPVVHTGACRPGADAIR